MTGIDEEFGQKVRALREAQGRSQNAVAATVSARSGSNVIHQTGISKIEAGRQSATLAQAVAIADALGVSLHDLLAGVQPSEGDLRLAIADLRAENTRLAAGLLRVAHNLSVLSRGGEVE